MKNLILMAVAVVALASCGGSADSEADDRPERSSDNAVERADVPWDDYDESVRERIDRLESGSRCDALQKEFDTASDTSDATMARTGHSNADLLEYIDEALQLAGCY